MEYHDAWFFVGVFVFIFLIWIATGGPTHPLAFSGPTLAEPGALGGGSYLSLPHSPFSIGSADVSLPGSSTGGGSLSGNSGTPIPNLSGTTFGEISPYRGIVSVSHYVSGAASTDPKNESIQLTVSQDANEPVDI